MTEKEFYTTMDRTIHAAGPLRGEVLVPGDKSISHRSVMFGALAQGKTEVTHFLMSADCLSTISCFEKMGIRVDVDTKEDRVTVNGLGLHSLHSPDSLLYTGNSGTTTRLICGILAGQSFDSVLSGDPSLNSRPMRRVIDPLTQMGASIFSEPRNGCCPLHISGSRLHGIDYRSPVASAQVKSCILLAGLYAEGETSVTESALSRNHTELMLAGFGASVRSEKTPDGWKASILPEPVLTGQKISVPGDISSAAYFIAAALTVPGSEVLIRNVGINPTRAGILEVVKAMGGDVELMNVTSQGGETAADLLVRSSSLHGVTIGGELIPSLIDELPVCAVMAACAQGETVIRDAAELKVKESDRISAMTNALSAMGCDITATDDGMIIRGGRPLHGAVTDSCKDHRIAMSLAVAALSAEGETQIRDADCVDISYPQFYSDLYSLIR